VLRVISRLNVGGPARQVILLARGLAERGFDTTLVTGSPGPHEGDMTEDALAAGVRLVRVPSLGRSMHPGRDGRALAALLAITARVRPDIVHTHAAKAGSLGRVAARALGVRHVVHTFHGHVFEGYFSPVTSAMIVNTERMLARLSSVIAAESEAARADVIARGIAPERKVVTILPGLDLRPLLTATGEEKELRRAWGAVNGAPVLGFVARLAPIKRAEVFIQLAARLARVNPDARCVLIGDGEERERLEKMARELHARNVVFAGFRRDLAQVYRACDLVLLTSASEGLPYALIEAQAAGRPAVAFGVGGVPEVVRDGVTGRVVPGGDVDALYEATLECIRRPDVTRRLGEAGRVHVRDLFSETRLLDDVEEIYRTRAGC
jgi:glycosyltransferase involved in cell wall biosynthesis